MRCRNKFPNLAANTLSDSNVYVTWPNLSFSWFVFSAFTRRTVCSMFCITVFQMYQAFFGVCVTRAPDVQVLYEQWPLKMNNMLSAVTYIILFINECYSQTHRVWSYCFRGCCWHSCFNCLDYVPGGDSIKCLIDVPTLLLHHVAFSFFLLCLCILFIIFNVFYFYLPPSRNSDLA